MERNLGAILSKKDVRDYRPIAKLAMFPETFKLKLGPVKDQGLISSCVAHAIAETVEYHNALQGNEDKMSVGYIYGNRRIGGYKAEGMCTRDAIKATCTYGDAAYVDFPENEEVPGIINKFEKRVDALFDEASKSHFAKYYKVETEDEIKQALMTDGPVVFAMPWYKDFKIKDDVLVSSYDNSNKGGGHCMVIYGWEERGWRIRNSWGILWGKGGNAILPYDAPIHEAWGIADDKSNTPLKKPYSTRIGKFIAKILNFIINLFNKK